MAEITFVSVEAAQAFTEARSGKSYKPGEIITDETWLDNECARVKAYEARGKVKAAWRTAELDDGGPLFRLEQSAPRKARAKKEGE